MLAIVLAFGLLLAGTTAAQTLSALFPEGVPGYDAAPGVTVLSRARPAFDPLGLRAGSFILRPLLGESVGYDTNPPVSGSRGSWEILTHASLLAASDWSRDSIGAFVSADDTRYLSQPVQSRTDGTASVGGTIDIGRDRLTLAAAHLSLHQDQTQLGALPSDQPIVFRVDDLRASYVALFGRWTATPNIEAASWHFGDATMLGVPASQSYRDHLTLQGGLTVRYEWAPLRSLVLVTRALGQHYTETTPGQTQADSTGYDVLAGFYYDDDSVWRYRLLAGAETRQFASGSLPPHTGLIAEAEVTWSPSAMTTLHGTLTRSLEDAAQEGVGGFTYTGLRLHIDHEYRRDLLLSASGGAQHAAYLQDGGQQMAYALGVGVTWLMNRAVRVSATYDLTALRDTQAPATLQLSHDMTRSLALVNIRFGL